MFEIEIFLTQYKYLDEVCDGVTILLVHLDLSAHILLPTPAHTSMLLQSTVLTYRYCLLHSRVQCGATCFFTFAWN